MEYHFSKIVRLTFDDAVERVMDELKKEGFGVVTEIDMKETLRKKLNVRFRNYTILGACNPQFAYEALQEEDKIGLFLPCNIVIQEHESGEVEISVVNPEELLHNVNDLNMRTFATQVRESLQQVLEKC